MSYPNAIEVQYLSLQVEWVLFVTEKNHKFVIKVTTKINKKDLTEKKNVNLKNDNDIVTLLANLQKTSPNRLKYIFKLNTIYGINQSKIA